MPSRVRRSVLSVSTMLTPTERIRVDAAGEGSYRAMHRDSVAEVVHDIRTSRVGAVLVSVARCDQRSKHGVAALVREFPRIPTVALLTQLDRQTPLAMMSLAPTGIRQLVDVREPDGWRGLRALLSAQTFRDQYDGEGMLQPFRQAIVLPHLDTLRLLRPLNPSWGASYARTLTH